MPNASFRLCRMKSESCCDDALHLVWISTIGNNKNCERKKIKMRKKHKEF